MKYFIFVLVSALMLTGNAFSQNYIRHKVAKSETITQIAQKYKVTPFDIYRLNPDSQSGIHENDIILIPGSVKATVTNAPVQTAPSKSKTHLVKPKETLFSIARDYNVDVNSLKLANATLLKDGLKSGQTIAIPGSGPIVATETKEQTKATEVKVTTPKIEKGATHIVAQGETKFAIAKKYGISVAELERQNPEIVPNLPAGYKLTINGGSKSEPTPERTVEKPKAVVQEIAVGETTQSETVKTVKKAGFANYEVKPKETMYSLTQMFNVSQDELVALNPSLKDGVKTGMILKVPGKGSVVVETRKGFEDLSKSMKTDGKKELVLLLPFNASRIQGDTLKSITTRLKNEQFLNMTLDFYAGALMAIDSAKTLGMNVNVRIFDSEESKTSSNVAAIIQANNLQSADAVIGPFYQQYVEKVADLLSDKNVPVISPLSKEVGKPYKNLYQAMPPSDLSKAAMMDFMMSKNGNIIFVSDPKRQSNRDFITQKYPGARFVAITETGTIDSENLKSLLVKGQMNYVVLDSEKTGMILSATNTLLNEIANFQIQLAIIEPNETLDFEEVSMKRLTILKLIYPSLTRENDSEAAVNFQNEYKKKNKIFPSQYATRGFDVTFDTLLRLSQGNDFAASANEDRTEQIESKFEYTKKDSQGYVNKGIYILQYNEDLSVKEAN